MDGDPFLPKLVSGRWQRAALTEGPQPRSGEDSATLAALAPLHHSLRSRSPSPSKLGEEFSVNAARLAGHAGILFGWSPDIFWAATPAEFAALVTAAAGEQPAPVDLAALMEMHPDG